MPRAPAFILYRPLRMFSKSFTVAEANSLLPEIEKTLATVDRSMAEMSDIAEKLQVLEVLWGEEALLEPDNPDHDEAKAYTDRVAKIVERVERSVAEGIIARGALFPPGGVDYGLVDFPTLWEGRWVLLCWRRGEPELEAWHELDGGFAGRQPISPRQSRQMGMRDGRIDVDDYSDS